MMDIFERFFEDVLEHGLLQHGPDAGRRGHCARDTVALW
jgi:hypothetical protein